MKLKNQDENEFQVYVNYLNLKNRSQTMGSLNMSNYMSYNQTKLYEQLNVRITSEEEKYIYLIKHISTYEATVSYFIN